MNRRTFYAKQAVAPSELNQAFGDVEGALTDVIRRALGWGWVWGGNVTFDDTLSPAQVTVSPFYGFTKTGNTIRFESSANIALSRIGDLPLGAGGTADGVAVAPGNGQWCWYTILVYHERQRENLVKTGPPAIYWSNLDSFRVKLLAGAVKNQAEEESDPPAKPEIPASGEFLVLADVFVRNDGTGTFVEQVDFSRRSSFVFANWKSPFLETGFPCLLNKASYSPTLPLTDADGAWPTGDDEGIWRFTDTLYGGDGHAPAFEGLVYYTQAGMINFKLDYAAAAVGSHDAAIFTIPIINETSAPIDVTLDVVQAAGGIFQYSALGAPFTGPNAAPSAFGVSTATNYQPEVTFIPGRNRLVLFYVRKDAARLTCGQRTDFLNPAKYPGLRIDSEYLRHFLGRANNNLIFEEYTG